MRCTLESKRGDGGKMKNKKEGLFIQCIVCSLLPLITLFIPYLKFGISVPLLGKSHGTTDRNGFTKSYGKCK